MKYSGTKGKEKPDAHAPGIPRYNGKRKLFYYFNRQAWSVTDRQEESVLLLRGFQRGFAKLLKERFQFERSAAGAESGGLVSLFKLGSGVF